MVSHARPRTLLFLGGNGHGPARLSPVRSCLEALGDAAAFEITEALYPGFDGRPAPSSLDAFLSGISWGPVVPHLTYATGIGGLIALCLRARSRLPGPLLMQAPILWGLERRVFPKVMRAPGVARAVGLLLATPILQRRFFRKHFRARHSPAVRGAFAAGYRRCAVFPKLFHWLTPALLRRLEGEHEVWDDIQVWWGEHDTVVGPEELEITRRALGVEWPLRIVAGWGHYPMIDDPDGWVQEISHALA